MEMLRRPLEQSLTANRAELSKAEERYNRDGDPSGNRRQRRIAARNERLERRRQKLPAES